jgi:hypothetical protein
MFNIELRLLLILIIEIVKHFYSNPLDPLYVVGVKSCELIKSMSFQRFWLGSGNSPRSNDRNSYSL